MPNFEEDPWSQRPRPLPNSASQRQNLPAQPGPIEQSSGPGAPAWIENQSGQEPLFLTMPASGSNEPQYQLSRVPETSRVPRRSSNVAMARQTDGGELQPVDYMLIGIILFLFVACILTIFVLVIPRLRSGGNPSFDFSNLGHVLFLMLIYTLCVIAGILSGRYQSKTAEGREKLQL